MRRKRSKRRSWSRWRTGEEKRKGAREKKEGGNSWNGVPEGSCESFAGLGLAETIRTLRR